ncbi:hypothetical protein ACKFKG_03790 [Phormidesmis sp. 146-35]|jgi:hypothetical protein
MNNQPTPEVSELLTSLKRWIWILCIPAWLFGAIERGATAFSHPWVTPLDLLQILTAAFFLTSWLLLKPRRSDEPTA